ncbi:hypothetical protein SELMODRAFT_420289 [Selaginella moellendorffii]|uniref:Uncharacterized protein n=1 Tax=Selaginella moellendorffii TaxID=88036 RepID=D8SBI7_SELML|nr:hypothetical protein SELMODRAFT_420289 [Selaginella moellendorffii]
MSEDRYIFTIVAANTKEYRHKLTKELSERTRALSDLPARLVNRFLDPLRLDEDEQDEENTHKGCHTSKGGACLGSAGKEGYSTGSANGGTTCMVDYTIYIDCTLFEVHQANFPGKCVEQMVEEVFLEHRFPTMQPYIRGVVYNGHRRTGVLLKPDEAETRSETISLAGNYIDYTRSTTLHVIMDYTRDEAFNEDYDIFLAGEHTKKMGVNMYHSPTSSKNLNVTSVLLEEQQTNRGKNPWMNKCQAEAKTFFHCHMCVIRRPFSDILIRCTWQYKPKHKEPVPTKLWRKDEMHKSYSQGDEAYGKKTEPVVHITVYGLERNFCFLGGEAKRLLAQLSIVVPDTEVEAGKQSVEAKSWLHMLLPDTYKLPIPNVYDIKELEEKEGAFCHCLPKRPWDLSRVANYLSMTLADCKHMYEEDMESLVVQAATCASPWGAGASSVHPAPESINQVLAQMKDRARTLDHNLLASVSPGIWEVPFESEWQKLL